MKTHGQPWVKLMVRASSRAFQFWRQWKQRDFGTKKSITACSSVLSQVLWWQLRPRLYARQSSGWAANPSNLTLMTPATTTTTSLWPSWKRHIAKWEVLSLPRGIPCIVFQNFPSKFYESLPSIIAFNWTKHFRHYGRMLTSSESKNQIKLLQILYYIAQYRFQFAFAKFCSTLCAINWLFTSI